MQQFRKKPVAIEAFQMTEERRMNNSEWPEWLGRAWNGNRDERGTLQRVSMTAELPDELELVTLEGNHRVSWGTGSSRASKVNCIPASPISSMQPMSLRDPASSPSFVATRDMTNS